MTDEVKITLLHNTCTKINEAIEILKLTFPEIKNDTINSNMLDDQSKCIMRIKRLEEVVISCLVDIKQAELNIAKR